ncbi:MAG: winged helix-turn-helix domain-containing protein [Desulfarculaceae bacterium]|jgi:predicted transcriptional regulator
MATKAKPGLNSTDKKILKALADSKSPLANKQIAQATGLESKDVSSAMKALKGQGLVDSPARCKYGLTGSGKAVLKK